MSSYTYQPIDPWTNTIRLLRLFQGRRHYNDGRVCGELFEAQLPDERDDTYEALSYTWGDPTRTKSITINGRTVSVTTNLYDALLHLRDPEKDRVLWVDALCINQQDAFERTHQVAKMSSIYQRAWAVVVWLGKTTRDIELLLEATKALDKVVRQHPRPSSNTEHLKAWIDEGHRFISEKRTINPNFYEIRRRALKELLSRSWFRRVWVVQEAAYARTAYIQCSWISVPTRMFCIMPYLLEIDMDARSQALLEVLPGPLRQNSWWNDKRGLSTILQKFCAYESTDPRDQIFALLGLSTDCAKDGQCFLPNYELTTLESVQQTVFFLAFGEILNSDMFSLPAWDLEEFRHKLPSLRLALLEWGIEQDENGVPVVRKLLHEAPCFDVNQRIFSELLLPLQYLILAQKSTNMIRIFLDGNLDALHAKAAFNIAVEHDRADIIHSLLVRNDVEIACSPHDIRSALEYAITVNRSDLFDEIARRFQVGLPHREKISLLHYATKRGSTFAITMLVRDGVRADARHNPEHETPLMIAVDNGLVEVADVLARSGANINLKDSSGHSPLLMAVCRGDVKMSRTLIDIGAEIPATIVPFCIRLWIRGLPSSKKKMAETLELLANRGADINAMIDHPYPTGLFQAIGIRNVTIVEKLISLGADLDIKTRGGETALIFAARTGLCTAVDLLVTAGASLIEEGRFGRNALWTAVVHCRIEVLWLLGKHGADFQLSENTAVRLPGGVYAKEGIRLRIRQYLLSRGVDLSVWECVRAKKRMELPQKYERLF